MFAVWVRGLADTMWGTLPILLLCLFSVLYSFFRLTEPRELSLLQKLILILSSVLVSVAFYGFYVWVQVAVIFAGWLYKSMPAYSVLFPVVVLSVGSTLFMIRQRYRFFYGVTEIVVGLAVAVHLSQTYSSDATNAANVFIGLVTAGAYLVVRGLDNVQQGLATENKDLLARLWLRYMRPAPGNAHMPHDSGGY